MHLIEDYRKKKGDDDDKDDKDYKETGEHMHHVPFDPSSEDISLNDSDALKLKGENPLAEEEGTADQEGVSESD